MQLNCRMGRKAKALPCFCFCFSAKKPNYFSFYFVDDARWGMPRHIINMKHGTCIIGWMVPSAMHLCVAAVGNPVQTGISKFSTADLCGLSG